MSSWCFCFEVAVNITMPCTLPKFGWFHLSLWYYEFVLSPPFHHGCYFEPWFLHLWVTRQLARSIGGGRKIKMMKCDFFLKPGTHAGQNPNIINSSPPPPNFKQQVIRGELWPSLGEIHETQASETIPVCREHICERRTL